MYKLLIIQDSPSINFLLKSRLEPEGFEIDLAETGEDGLKMAKTGKYQLILLDFLLPGIDGTKVFAELKKFKETKAIPVLFMSAKEESELKNIINTTGAEGFITLPCEGKELAKKIKGYIN
ncbi:MAG: response regulator [Pseudomonadota bacterium]